MPLKDLIPVVEFTVPSSTPLAILTCSAYALLANMALSAHTKAMTANVRKNDLMLVLL